MAKTITTRLPDEFVSGLREVAKKEHVDTSTAVRKLLASAIAEWKIKNALENLSLHKISIGKAAQECGISIWEMIELAKEKNVNWTGYTKEDLEKELRLLK